VLTGRVRVVVAFGESRDLVKDALGGVVEVRAVESLREAVTTAFGLARPAGVVLLSPACSSFDMFRDYAERGRAFKEEVARLARQGEAGP
jgi:UDP-N-acetylmuramoylalanine--D-glutamate ligase